MIAKILELIPLALGGGVITTLCVFILLVLRRPTLPGGLESPHNTYRRLFERSLGGGLMIVVLLIVAGGLS